MDMKKPIRVTLIAIPALLVLITVIVLVAIRTQPFHRFLLTKIIQQTEKSTGARIEIKRLNLRWSPFTADFYGVTVHGQEASDEPPLLVADHLGVSLGIRALLKHEADLYSIVVDRPVWHVRADTHGNMNLPKTPASNSSSNFKVIVRHAALRDGLVNYNDQQIPLSAELDDFRAQAEYDASASVYRGSLGYRQGCIITTGMNPVEHTVRVEFTASQNGVIIDPLVFYSGRNRFTAHIKMADFANPKVEGNYDGVLVTREIAEILKNPTLPRGEISFSGELGYQNVPNKPLLETLNVQGRLDSAALAVNANQISTAVKSIHGIYRLQNGNLQVQKLDANLLDGHLSARMDMLHLGSNPSSHLSADVRGLSLGRISDALPAESRQNARLIGKLNLSAQANWTKSIQGMKARSHLEINAPTMPNPQPKDIPVNGVVDMAYDGAKQTASLGRSQLRVADTELSLSGVVGKNSALNVELNAKNLQQLSKLAAAFSAPGPNGATNGQPVPATGYELHGAAHFLGQVTGPTNDPRLQGQLSTTNLEVRGSKWQAVRVNLDASSSGVQLQNGYLATAQKGQISFSARTALDHWSFKPDNPLSLQAKISNLSVSDLARLGELEYPVTGNLSGDIAVNGSEQQPVGHGSLQLVKASAWNEPIDSLKLDFQGNRDSLQSNAQLRARAGAAEAKLTYVPKTQHYEMNLHTDGLKLDQLQSLQERAGAVNGTLTLNVSGQGTVRDPQVSGNLQIPQLQVRGQTFSGVKADLALAHQHAQLTVESVADQGYINVKGGVDLTGQYPGEVTVDVRALPIGPLLAKQSTQTGATQDLRGYTEIHANVKGPFKEPARLEGRLEIPRLDLNYKTIQLANDGTLRIVYRNGVATVEQARIKGTGTDVSLQGIVPVQSNVPLNVSAKGAIDVSLLQIMSPDTHASGRVEINLRAGGNVRQPATQGNIRIVNTALAQEGAPVALSKVNGQLSISGNRLQIDQLDGTAGGGTISAHGSATYGQQINFAMDIQAKSVRIRPTGIRSTLDGNLQLNGTPQTSQLTGQILVDRLSFQEGFDLGTFLSQLSENSAVSTPSPFETNMRLGISVQSTQSLNASSSQVSIAGNANLNVTGTAANPVILGRITLTGGDLFFQKKRFEIENGTIAFANPVRTEPVLNLYVKTTVEQYNITINFSGPLDRLRTNYTSDPALPPVDIINLLAFGQTTAEKASQESTPASLAAQNVVAGQAASAVASKVQNLTGISQLTIDPTAGNNQNPGAQIAVQQRVTGTILMTFSTDVTSTQRQTVQLQYQPKKQLKFTVVRDEYGGYGIDVRLHKVF
jgi:translocation and assembly module TamB